LADKFLDASLVFIADKDMKVAQIALKQAQKAIVSVKYDIVILDEICISLYYKLLNLEQIMYFLLDKPAHVELILTGRYCPKELQEKADLVTEMKEINIIINTASQR
jgi:cob(I)alamin adenosyltransferase